MERRVLGATGLTVSRLGFGGAVLGIQDYLRHWDGDSPSDEATAARLIASALDHGITLFDTAADYGEGRSERLIGATLGNRDGVVVTSKFPIWKRDRMDLAETVEASLTRLRRDRLDVLQIHGLSYDVAERDAVLEAGGILQQMEALVAAGKVGHVGFTAEDANPVCYEFIATGRFATAQLCFNLVQNEAYNPRRQCGPMLAAAQAGMGILAMRTMTSGMAQRFLQAAGIAVTPDFGQYLLRFVLGNPLVDCALVGFTAPEEIAQCAAVFEMPPLDVAAIYDPMVAS